MGVFEMVAIVVVAGIIGEMYQARLKTQGKMEEQRGTVSEVSSRLAKIEQRLNNLEEIVLDREKNSRFEASL
jgi:cell division protein FtsL